MLDSLFGDPEASTDQGFLAAKLFESSRAMVGESVSDRSAYGNRAFGTATTGIDLDLAMKIAKRPTKQVSGR